MKALLKTGEWVEIDTTVLFNNQYNTTEKSGNRRIFDKDIEEIQDDARLNKGRCRYCGAIVERGKEKEHFEQKKLKKCSLLETDNCFWKRKRILNQEHETIERKLICTENVFTEHEHVKNVTKFSFYCQHDEKYGGCTHEQCEKFGVEWFTKENCFFLKYPKGYKDFTDVDFLSTNGWILSGHFSYRYRHEASLGSYILCCHVSINNRIINFELYNSRKRIVFLYDYKNKCFIISDCFGKNVSEHLLPENKDSPKCNKKINETVKSILQRLLSRA